jgi:DNA-binding CsgD family transcriptional regulator
MNGLKEDEILQELRRISKLLVLTATKDQTQKDRIVLLSRIGFEPKDIASLLGTTPGTVSVTPSIIKKKAKGETSGTKGSPRKSKSSDK